jgi:hypothetical protein
MKSAFDSINPIEFRDSVLWGLIGRKRDSTLAVYNKKGRNILHSLSDKYKSLTKKDAERLYSLARTELLKHGITTEVESGSSHFTDYEGKAHYIKADPGYVAYSITTDRKGYEVIFQDKISIPD